MFIGQETPCTYSLETLTKREARLRHSETEVF